jgi:hypothetical protein
MQIIVFTKETGKLVLHSGPEISWSNHIIELYDIVSVTADNSYYKAVDSENNIKLRTPIKKTNVIYK